MRPSTSTTFAPVTNYNTNLMSYTLTTATDGLVAGTIYVFRFYATNARGNSPYSNEVQFVCEALPNPPANLYKVDSKSTSNSIYVQWDQVADTTTPVTGYRLYMDTGNTGNYFLVFDGSGLPGVLSYNVKNLTIGQSYRFKVTALNFNGESADSNEVIFYSCLPPTNLAAPTYSSSTSTTLTI